MFGSSFENKLFLKIDKILHILPLNVPSFIRDEQHIFVMILVQSYLSTCFCYKPMLKHSTDRITKF